MKNNLNLFHPFLIGLYSVLALIAINISQIDPASAIRPLVAAILATGLFYLIISRIIHDKHKAALVTSWLLVMVFSYGHVYEALESNAGWINQFGRHRILILIWIGISALGTWLILRKLKQGYELNSIVSVFALAIIVIALIQTAGYKIGLFQLERTRNENLISQSTSGKEETGKMIGETPDVYYIILDGYSRDDVLKLDGFDNSEFIQGLRDRGFYIAECSQSNYAETPLSISSSSNMDYIDEFAPSYITKKFNTAGLGGYIRNSKVREVFSSLGYKFASFETGVPWDEITDADYYITSKEIQQTWLEKPLTINSFETMYLRTTLFRILMEFKGAFLSNLSTVIQTPEETQYERVVSTMDQLRDLDKIPGPKFVFAHIVSPHVPYVFNSVGQFEVTEDYAPGYFNNIRYLNKRTLEVVDSLINNSSQPPIIIIQADHSSNETYKHAILNAYYLPSGGEKKLYPSISPINSFRVVFDYYFGKQFPLLPDISHYSRYKDVYNFQTVQHPCDVTKESGE
jgi:hypothetical protein